MRKICVVSSNSTIDSIIDPRFGRGAFLIFLDEKGDIEETIPNPGVETFRGAGIVAAQEVVNRGADVLISRDIGPNSFQVLQSSGIKIFLAPIGVSVKEAFKLWKEGKLSLVSAPMQTVGFRGGFGRGLGRGGGFGRGQGRGFGRRNWF